MARSVRLSEFSFDQIWQGVAASVRPHLRADLATGTIALVALALAFGGGTLQGLASDAVVQLCALPLLGLALTRLARKKPPREVLWPLLLIGAGVLLLILQLVPLPPDLWTALPGRAPFVAAFKAAGMSLPSEPLSLDSNATWFSLFSLLPAITVFLALLSCGFKTRRGVSLVILAFAFASVLLGLAQLAGGPASGLRFYTPTNTGDSVGFFANRNHYASLLALAVPISAAWFVGFSRVRHAKRWLVLVLGLTYVLLLLGLGMAHSRAGLILAFLGGLASTGLAWRPVAREDAKRPRSLKLPLIFIIANLCGLLAAFEFGFVGIANRIEHDNVLTDLRWPIAEVTSHAIGASMPWGVGFGAFEPIYQMFEPVAVTLPAYVNHAHDDWLEIALDGGVPAILLLAAFLLWYGRASVRVWRTPPSDNVLDAALARAAPIVIGLLLLHSTVDYPLRTTALMVVFAAAAAMLIAPVNVPIETATEEPRHRSHRRRRRRSSTGRTKIMSQMPEVPSAEETPIAASDDMFTIESEDDG